MFKNLNFFYSLKEIFDKSLKNKFYLTIIYNVIFSFLEILNFLLLFPFFKLIFTPRQVDNKFIIDAIDRFSLHYVVFFYAGFFLIFSILRNLISLKILEVNKVFFIEFNSYLTNDLLNKTINIPYAIFAKYNYTEFPRLIYNDLNYFIFKGLNSFFILINEVFLVFFILVYLFSVDFSFVLFLVIVLFSVLFIINKTQSNDLKELVLQREQNLKFSLSELNEFYLANKEIRFLGLKLIAIPNLVQYLSKTFNNYENIKLFEKKPRIFLESFIYVFIVIVTLVASFYFNINSSVFSVIILGFLRMTPSASKINSLLNSIKASYPVLKKLLYFKYEVSQLSYINDEKLYFHSIDSFELKNYSVLYDDKIIFNQIDLIAQKGDIISVYGNSGSGKTSLFDSFFGYCLKSNNAQLIINNIHKVDFLNSNHVSYFSQNTYLLNKSLLFNFTLQEDDSKVDYEFLNKLISIFLLDDKISDLEDGLNSICGFGGFSFSGGERQRIGMVRAFYNKKDIIILDEFTSALDSNTEVKIIENLTTLLKELNSIVFIISHNSYPHKLSNKSINLIKND